MLIHEGSRDLVPICQIAIEDRSRQAPGNARSYIGSVQSIALAVLPAV
jgi:hypothetical protein